MTPQKETPSRGGPGASEVDIRAASRNASEDNQRPATSQTLPPGLDPQRRPIIARHWFGRAIGSA
jgi:hypothetical protein